MHKVLACSVLFTTLNGDATDCTLHHICMLIIVSSLCTDFDGVAETGRD